MNIHRQNHRTDPMEYPSPVVLHPDPASIPIEESEVVRLLGYEQGKDPEAKIRSILKKNLRAIPGLITPAVKFAIIEVDRDRSLGDTVELFSGVCLQGSGISTALSGAMAAALFAVTAGEGVEREITRLSSESVVDAFILDACASTVAETLARVAHGQIDKEATTLGLHTGYRYSPGYCDWDLSEQGKLFDLLKPDDIGLRLGESFMMMPRKSITGVIGLGRDREEIRISPCAACDDETCMTRRQRSGIPMRGGSE